MTRTVHCEDALAWLEGQGDLTASSFVASMPDISEFPGYSLEQWKEWFTKAAELILRKTSPDGVTIFYQSDIKHDGVWVDKGYLCQKAAEAVGAQTLWHKIVCRAPAGVATFGRPAYSHILCFSQALKLDPGRSTADVLPSLGEKTWERGMGLEAAVMIAKFIKAHTKGHTVVNPFCGMGTMLAAANGVGLSAIGIERSPKRAEAARKLTLTADLKDFNDQ